MHTLGAWLGAIPWLVFALGFFFGVIVGCVFTAGMNARPPEPLGGPLKSYRSDAYPAPYRSREPPL